MKRQLIAALISLPLSFSYHSVAQSPTTIDNKVQIEKYYLVDLF